jgi:hypothetical protein
MIEKISEEEVKEMLRLYDLKVKDKSKTNNQICQEIGYELHRDPRIVKKKIKLYYDEYKRIRSNANEQPAVRLGTEVHSSNISGLQSSNTIRFDQELALTLFSIFRADDRSTGLSWYTDQFRKNRHLTIPEFVDLIIEYKNLELNRNGISSYGKAIGIVNKRTGTLVARLDPTDRLFQAIIQHLNYFYGSEYWIREVP